MSEHTPGPWSIDRDGLTVYAHGDMGKRVADIRGWGWLQYKDDGAEIQDANARLIAAAPQLLEACEALYQLHCDGAFTLTDEQYRAITMTAAAIHAAREG